MKPLPKVAGKPSKELNYDSIMKGCLRHGLRVILYYNKDGFIVRAIDMEYKYVEDYFQWGEKIHLNMGVIGKIKFQFKQRYAREYRSSIQST